MNQGKTQRELPEENPVNMYKDHSRRVEEVEKILEMGRGEEGNDLCRRLMSVGLDTEEEEVVEALAHLDGRAESQIKMRGIWQ